MQSPGEEQQNFDIEGSKIQTSALAGFRKLMAFLGPAFLVSVGYMDPGNWATDIDGGSRFGYELLWVLVLSNLIAVLLQTLCARMGLVTGRHLAELCRDEYPPLINNLLWVLCELAIAATDLAEVLGTAIGLNLMFGLPMLWGVVITILDTFLFLLVQNLGIRVFEGMILLLLTVISLCFVVEIFLSKPDPAQIVRGFVPVLHSDSLYTAIGMLGATVMPHNFYLHSAIVQTRAVDRSHEALKQACRYMLIDCAVALNLALVVNASILIVAAANFHNPAHHQPVVVQTLQDAHDMLEDLLDTKVASMLFGLALVCSGQSSTLTGTLTGQFVMEGFLDLKLRPWLRRLLTRAIAVVPSFLTILFMGSEGTYRLLLLSQVVLSLQLPFAVVPVVKFTNSKRKMGVFANGPVVKVLAWLCTALIVLLNVWLALSTVSDLLQPPPGYSSLSAGQVCLALLLILAGSLLLLLLGYMIFRKETPHAQAAGRWTQLELLDSSDILQSHGEEEEEEEDTQPLVLHKKHHSKPADASPNKL